MLMTREQIQELIADLQGTCNSISECLPTGFSEEDITQEQFEEIDLEIFRCATCDWWFEVSEEQGQDENKAERICEGCQEFAEPPS